MILMAYGISGVRERLKWNTNSLKAFFLPANEEKNQEGSLPLMVVRKYPVRDGSV